MNEAESKFDINWSNATKPIASFNQKFLTIKAGEGSVRINLNDGSIVFDNCKPDEAAMAFWDAVSRMFNLKVT